MKHIRDSHIYEGDDITLEEMPNGLWVTSLGGQWNDLTERGDTKTVTVGITTRKDVVATMRSLLKLYETWYSESMEAGLDK